jgi:hypothetical protein
MKKILLTLAVLIASLTGCKKDDIGDDIMVTHVYHVVFNDTQYNDQIFITSKTKPVDVVIDGDDNKVNNKVENIGGDRWRYDNYRLSTTRQFKIKFFNSYGNTYTYEWKQ